MKPIRLVVCLLLVACTGAPPPIVDHDLAARGERPILVFVPGITGSVLRDRTSGEIVWGDGKRLISPHDRGYSLVRPIPAGPAAPSRLEATKPIEVLRVGPLVKPIYGPLLALFAANGYRRGDLDAPTADDSLYPFAYDWRLDNVQAAHRLFDKLEGVRRARGLDRLTVDLVCQSNGAHICRYVAKYGNATLADAAAGRAGPPTTLDIRKMILAGTANGGSIRVLLMLDRGRRYVPLFGRRLRQETLFTLPALYQELPSYRDDPLLGGDGRPLDVDLYDAATWRRFGWSIFAPEVAARVAKAGRDDLFGTVDQRVAFLQRSLDRARLLQQALQADVPGFGNVRYHLIQSDTSPTAERAVVERHGAGWVTHFVDDRALRDRPELAGETAGPGDGHATVASQSWLSPQERAAMASPPVYVDGPHFEMILLPETHRHLLDFLSERMDLINENR